MADKPSFANGMLLAALSLFWMWLFFMFFVACGFPDPEKLVNVRESTILRATNMIGMSVGLACSAAVTRFRPGSESSPPFALASALLTPAISALGALQIVFGFAPPLAVHLLAGFTSGLGQSCLLVQIGAALIASSSRDRTTIVIASGSFGGLAAFALSLINPLPALLIAMVSAPLAQIALLAADIDGTAARTEQHALREVLLEKDFSRLGINLFMFSLLFGLGSAIGIFRGVSQNSLALLCLPLCFQGPAYVILKKLLKREPAPSGVSEWLMTAGTVCALVMPFTHGSSSLACVLVLSSAWQVFDIIAFLRLYDLCDTRSYGASAFALGRLMNSLGKALGWLLGFVLLQTGVLNESLFVYLMITVTAALMIVRTAVHGRLEQSEPPKSNDEPVPLLDDAISSISKSSGLSPREAEVFALLARGRTSAHIGEKLFISKNTVKSHASRIYQKTGVHTQQELLDLVERWGASGDAGDGEGGRK